MSESGDLFAVPLSRDPGDCHACAIGDLQLASARDETAHLRQLLAVTFEAGLLDARPELKARAVVLLGEV